MGKEMSKLSIQFYIESLFFRINIFGVIDKEVKMSLTGFFQTNIQKSKQSKRQKWRNNSLFFHFQRDETRPSTKGDQEGSWFAGRRYVRVFHFLGKYLDMEGHSEPGETIASHLSQHRSCDKCKVHSSLFEPLLKFPLFTLVSNPIIQSNKPFSTETLPKELRVVQFFGRPVGSRREGAQIIS